VKTPPLGLSKGMQGAFSGPKTVFSLRQKDEDLSFICASKFLAVYARILSKNFLGVLTPDTYTVLLLRRSPRGGGFSIRLWL
jgi:hypothetical protein